MDLAVGDYWTVPLPSGGRGVVQVRDVQRTGPGARTTFVAGVVEWRGEEEPTPDVLRGKRVLAQGLMSVSVFTEGGSVVLGNAPGTKPVAGLASAFRDFKVGTKTQSWGWKVLPARVEKVLADARQ